MSNDERVAPTLIYVKWNHLKGHTMKLTRLFVPAAGLSLMLGVGAAFAQYGPPQGYPPGPPPGYREGPPINYGARGWDAPPGELREFQRQGFLDGVQGAERDYQNHRIWNVNNRDEFRHPHVPPNMRGDYRAGFKRGYYLTVRHYQGGPGPYGPR